MWDPIPFSVWDPIPFNVWDPIPFSVSSESHGQSRVNETARVFKCQQVEVT